MKEGGSFYIKTKYFIAVTNLCFSDLFCDFENGDCGFTFGGNGGFTFSVKNGGETSPDISEDHNYNPEGHFLFAKSSGNICYSFTF